MRILGLDFETTGLSAEKDHVIEIGAVVWETETKKPVTMYSELIKPEGFIGLPTEIIQITGIDDQSLFDYGVEAQGAFKKLHSLIESTEFIVAHNAPFDRSFLNIGLEKWGLPPVTKSWLDTLADIPYPKGIVTRKLDYLAAEHKVLNPFSHRAVFDVLTMLSVLNKYDLKEVIERSKSPNVEVTAIVSFDEKDKAKDLGFHWDGKGRRWFKDFKQCDLDEMDFPFQINVEQKQLSFR
jgi:DNA polymerase III alpha subunit (gram-positive type)